MKIIFAKNGFGGHYAKNSDFDITWKLIIKLNIKR